MVTQGYPTDKAKLSEVIDATNPKRACQPLNDLHIGDQWYAGFGGVIDGVIVVCGGNADPDHSKDCFAYKNNTWTKIATLKHGKNFKKNLKKKIRKKNVFLDFFFKIMK